jgi:PAS domain-containing protein
MLATFNRQFLSMSGYTEEELRGLGDLSILTPQRVQELVRQKSMQSLGLKGNSQKIVPMSEAKEWIVQGWEFVNALPNGEAIVRLPR